MGIKEKTNTEDKKFLTEETVVGKEETDVFTHFAIIKGGTIFYLAKARHSQGYLGRNRRCSSTMAKGSPKGDLEAVLEDAKEGMGFDA